MHWTAHNHCPGTPDAGSRLELLETYWRMRGPSGRILSCALYRTAAGLEVRAQYTVDDLMRSQLVRSGYAGDDVAAVWKLAVLEKGGFVELDSER